MTRSLAPVQVAFDPPPNPSRKAIDLGGAKSGTTELRGDGEQLLMGEPKQALGHLAGRARGGRRMFALGTAAPRNEQRVERLVRGGGSVTLTIKPEKGGQVAREIALA